MELGIRGRKALITGADSGIGFATAKLMLSEGAKVVITDLYQDKLEEAANHLSAAEGQLYAFIADITSIDSLNKLSLQVQKSIGDIEILVQSAGITGAQGLFHEIEDEGWNETLLTDLIGPVRVIRTFLPALRKNGWGRIVFLASEDAQQTYPKEIPYCVSKAGILALSKGLSKTYAKEGILVNAVSPAFIATPMTDAMMDKRAKKRGTNAQEAIASFLDEEKT